MEGRNEFCRVADKSLAAVNFLQIVKNSVLQTFAVRDLALFQADVGKDLLFGEDRVALDLDVAELKDAAFGNRNDDLQRVIL